MKRKMILLNTVIFALSLLAVTFAALSGLDAKASTVNLTSGVDVLRFPVNNYTEQSLIVPTSPVPKNVTYRLYRHIAYVANPVDLNYQSLDVGVPVEIDGQDINAANAPILLVVINGGYMSSSNTAGGIGRLPTATDANFALAAGYVVVVPGLRGWNCLANGTYFGKAPAAIVDLKAAVRYIRYNKGVIPGNTNWIVSAGISGGGALSSLLGVSGNSPLYDAALQQIGAANATDNVFASAPYCPITDLDHADMGYEWEFGTTPFNGSLVNQTISQQLKNAFSTYEASLKLQGKNAYGNLTADNYGDYLVKTYLIPSANNYLSALTTDSRNTYLTNRTWITWTNNSASFTWTDYVAYVGRSKKLPAFDAFDLSAWENNLFGNSTTNGRHFTNFSLQQASGNPNAVLDADVPTTVSMMNPMYFIMQNYSGCAQYWFIRTGTKDTDTAHVIFGNLATSLENRGKSVNGSLYWDAGHGVNLDPEVFVAWVRQITNYSIVLSSGGWSRTYGGSGTDIGTGDTEPTIDGGYVVSGDTNSSGAGGTDFWLFKTDSSGNMLWTKTYGGPLDETCGDMCLAGDGGFALAGNTRSFGAGGRDVYLVKTDAAGNMVWNKTYGGAGDEYMLNIIQTSDSGYMMSGYTASFGAGANDAWLIKTDTNGIMQWNKTYGGSATDMGYDLVQTSDGGYTFTGYTSSFGAGGNDAWLVRTDANGNMLWNKTYGGNSTDQTYALARTADGGYAMAGYTQSFGGTSAYLIRTDASGNMLWNKTYPRAPAQIALHMIKTADEGFALVGWNYVNGQDLLLIKTDSAGNLQFNMTYGGPGLENGYAILQTSDGGYLLTGTTTSFGAGGSDAWLVKTDASGVSSIPSPPTPPSASAFSSATVWTGWTWWFSVHGSGGVAPYTFQWYEGTTLLAGQTSMVLSVTKNSPGTYTFYCRVSDSAGATANSNTVTLTVVA
jgi:acetyl esterase/lipase